MQAHERLKTLRKEKLHLNQEEFGSQIGISRGNVANIEVGRITLTERNIKTICLNFNVNEEWLRYGIEPVFNELTKEEEIASYIGGLLSSDKKNDFQKRFIRALSKLDDDGWDVIEQLLNDIVKKED